MLLDGAECTPISSPRQREILGSGGQGGSGEPIVTSLIVTVTHTGDDCAVTGIMAITLSCNIHTGRIDAISDQFALGTPWDEVRRTASQPAIQFRHAHGVKQPATRHEDELEYQEGWKERRARGGALRSSPHTPHRFEGAPGVLNARCV